MQTDKAQGASSPATQPAHHTDNNNPAGTEAIDPLTSTNANTNVNININANTNTNTGIADTAITAADPGNNPEYAPDRSGEGQQLTGTVAPQGSVNTASLDLIETTLGAHQWFDVPLMLSILMLGTFSLGAELIHNHSYPSLLLIGVYAVFNLAGAVLKHRIAPAPHALARVLSHNYLPLINFFVDSGFATGVLVLDTHDKRSVITILLVMAGARFLAHLPSGSAPLALLPILLPFIPLVFRAYFTPEPLSAPASIEDVLTLSLIVLCCLVIVFAITRKLNPRIAETARLTQALAESNENLRESRSRTEQHAQLLAGEVLRLDLLQDCIRAMNSAVELDDLLQMVVQNAVRVLKAEQSSIGLVDPNTRELVITCATGVDASSLRRRRFAPGMGVAGWVIQHGKPMLVGDVEQDPHYLYSDTDHITSSAQNEHNADDNAGNNNHTANNKAGGASTAPRYTRSMLCVPLVVENNITGTLCVTHSRPYAFTHADERLLVSFAEEAALAVHKSQLLEAQRRQSEELQRRERIISSLHSISQSVLSSLELPQVLDTVISRVSELCHFHRGAIYLLDEQGSELRLGAMAGGMKPANSPDVEGKYETPHSWPVTIPMDGTRPVNVPWAEALWVETQDAGTDGAKANMDMAHMVQTFFEGSTMLCVALVNLGKPLGCLILARNGRDPFSPIDQDAIKKLADAATMAIVNARLFSKVSMQQEQTALLYRLMLKVNAASNRRQLAQVICHELGQITGARSAALLMQDNEQARIALCATYGEWAAQAQSAATTAQHIWLSPGDPFMSSVLASLTGTGPSGPLIIYNAPSEIRRAFNSPNCVTIPLAQAGRVYGLLVIEPGSEPPILAELEETVRLAISHSTMAIERAELFEQTLASARHSSMLYRVAARVQSSLDSHTIIQMTVSSLMEAVPIQSCEVYTFGEDGRLTRREHAVATTSQDAGILLGPEIMDVDEPAVVEALQSSGPVMVGTVRGLDDAPHNVLMGRLMGSQDVIGLVRLTTNLSVEEFVHRHAIFCQTLFTHAGGALERSRLYATVAAQAEMLRTRARQLTDILRLGNISAADEPLLPVLPQIASGIAHSLGFAYVRIGDIGPGSSNAEVWASADEDWSGISGLTTKPLGLDSLERLLVAGAVAGGEATLTSPSRPAFRSAILDEALLARLVPGQPVPRPDVPPRRLILMLLESSSGGTLGYIIAALKPQAAPLPAPVPAPPTGNSPHSTAVVRDSSEGDLLELLGIFAQKISLLIENHRIYSQLLDSKRKIDAVVLSISDGVIVTDAELNVLISNALADSLLGVPSAESHGQSLARFIRHDALLAMLRDCIATSRPVSMDVELELGGETRTYEAVAHAISAPAPDMHVLGAVLTMRDVTLARATERAKSDFLSMVSHELRTPLNSVLGFLDITLMGKTGQLTDLQADFLSTARQEAQVLQRLINDLLDYSQLQSGMLRMEMAPVNLSSLIARVVNQARPLAQEDHLKIINNVPPGLIVSGDEVRLEQVFNNLLDNAAKFTDAHGEIVFSSRRKGATVTISVKDSGPGIPPSQLKEVFERFFQGDNSPRRRKRGLGLGLAICKNIVEAHDGHIWIESEPGKGTTVFVELPLFDPGDGNRTQQVLRGRAGAMIKNTSD